MQAPHSISAHGNSSSTFGNMLVVRLPPIPSSIRVFSSESTLHMRWQSTGVSALAVFFPKKSQGWSPSEWTGWISLQSKGLSRVFSNTTVQKRQFFSAQPSSQFNSYIHTWDQRSNPGHLHGECRVLATGLPEESCLIHFLLPSFQCKYSSASPGSSMLIWLYFLPFCFLFHTDP